MSKYSTKLQSIFAFLEAVCSRVKFSYFEDIHLNCGLTELFENAISKVNITKKKKINDQANIISKQKQILKFYNLT